MGSPTTPSIATTIEIIAWFLLVVSVFATFARVSTKWALAKAFNWDDMACVISLVLNVGAGVGASMMAENGLGEDQATLSKSSLQIFQKSMYVLELLHIGTLCFAKLSIILLLRLISPSQQHQRLGVALAAFIVVCGILSILLVGFQCKTPEVWRTIDGSCFNRVGFWRSVGVMNVVTDVGLIALPVLIVYRLQMSLKKKVTVLSCFGARSLDIVINICQLAYSGELQSDNLTLDVGPWILCAQLMQTTSIITSCIPYLRPLLEAFPSGMMVNDDISRHKLSSRNAEGYSKRPDHSYVLRDVSKGTRSESPSRRTEIEINDFGNNALPEFDSRVLRNKSHRTYAGDEISIVDNQSHHSSEKSQSRIIKATTTIEIGWHDRTAEENFHG